ncbi:MAG: hypothetical protein HYU86_09010 [Chloroflexi bacterium]|nr:hypothetical protein [Chloroflexota bacterium]
MEGQRDYWALRRRVSRREMLGRAARGGVGLAMVSLLGCAAAKEATPTAVKPVSGGKLTMAVSQMLGADPHRPLAGGAERPVREQVYHGICNLSPDAEIVPDLGESWEIPEPDRIVFKLKKGVKFHDGTDFDAAAVKFNYDRIMDPATQAYDKPRLEQAVKSVEVTDSFTVTYRLPGPSASFFYNVAAENLGVIVSPAAVKKYNNDLTQKGVGTGPFQHGEWVMDDHLTFQRFPEYWGKGLPYLDTVLIRIIPDETVRLTMLKTGELNFIHRVEPRYMKTLGEDPNLVAKWRPSLAPLGLALNGLKPPLNNKALRQAIAYAIDKKAITDTVLDGMAEPALGYYSSQYWFHNPNIKGYTYDLAKAKAKLAEGGYPNGFDLELVAWSGFPNHTAGAEVVQAQLGKIGIRVKVVVPEYAKGIAQWRAGEFQALLGKTSGPTDPFRHNTANLMKDAPYCKNSCQPNARIDQLIIAADQTYDKAERKRLFNELEQLLLDEVHFQYVIAHDTNRVAYNKRVQGFLLPLEADTVNLTKVWVS